MSATSTPEPSSQQSTTEAPPDQLCTFNVAGQRFGLDVRSVQEIIRLQEMTPVPLASSVVRGLINLRGQIVAAIDMRERLHMHDAPGVESPMNVVVRGPEGPISLLVDDIGDVIQVEESQLESPPGNLQSPLRDLVHAVYKLPGQLLLVLETERVIQVDAAN